MKCFIFFILLLIATEDSLVSQDTYTYHYDTICQFETIDTSFTRQCCSGSYICNLEECGNLGLEILLIFSPVNGEALGEINHNDEGNCRKYTINYSYTPSSNVYGLDSFTYYFIEYLDIYSGWWGNQAIHYIYHYVYIEECEDCEGNLGGMTIEDLCGNCYLTKEDPNFNNCLDCNGVPFGNAIIDECGNCNEQNSEEFNVECTDCNGVVNGNYLMDECGQCLHDEDEMFNFCLDCNEVPFGNAIIDSCGNCNIPETLSFNASCTDCQGTLFGEYVLDDCGQCLLQNDEAFNNCHDCFGIPNGVHYIDSCGNCVHPNDIWANRCEETGFYNCPNDTVVIYLPKSIYNPYSYSCIDDLQEYIDIFYESFICGYECPYQAYCSSYFYKNTFALSYNDAEVIIYNPNFSYGNYVRLLYVVDEYMYNNDADIVVFEEECEILFDYFQVNELTYETYYFTDNWIFYYHSSVIPVSFNNQCECGIAEFDYDECGDCLNINNADFNSCLDCFGIPYGKAIIDECGNCNEPNSEAFNQECTDCNGVVNGSYLLDECGQCLLPTDENFNDCGPPDEIQMISDDIVIIPNPATNYLKIETNEKLEKVMIYNIYGLKVIETTSKQIDVSKLSNGVYSIIVETPKNILTSKVIICR